MIIEVKVKAGAKENSILQISPKSYKISVKNQRERGKANEAVLSLLSKELKHPLSCLKIIKGSRGKLKFVELI
jgi:hypothetical protein